MDSATIQTEFDNLAYTPGETIRGTVSWRASAPPLSAVLRLFYHTSGKGTQDLVVVAEQVFDAPAGSDQRPYAFALPDSPYSCSGKLVSLIWALELEIDLGSDQLVEKRDFTLSPTGEEILLHAHAHENMPAYSDFGTGLGGRRSSAGER